VVEARLRLDDAVVRHGERKESRVAYGRPDGDARAGAHVREGYADPSEEGGYIHLFDVHVRPVAGGRDRVGSVFGTRISAVAVVGSGVVARRVHHHGDAWLTRDLGVLGRVRDRVVDGRPARRIRIGVSCELVGGD